MILRGDEGDGGVSGGEESGERGRGGEDIVNRGLGAACRGGAACREA